MTRRIFNRSVLGAAVARLAAQSQFPEPEKFVPNWVTLRLHRLPAWFDNAKLGIFIHWGLYSVPAWATPAGEMAKLPPDKFFLNNPYAEWYLNSLRIKGSPTYQHHLATYGKDFDYYSFARTFNESIRKWDPAQWAALFEKVGARYVVLTTKHHEGFTLWPSRVENPRRRDIPLRASRDLVGELTQAVRSRGMRMGLYYSGGLDWTFTSEPITNFQNLFERVPQSEEYARYADAHWFELIERYQPSVMWNDISYPRAGKTEEILAKYYNTVRDGVVNDRFGVGFSDYTTPEYASYDKITDQKWESCRGLAFSFGYNQVEGPEHMIAPGKLISLLVDIVSKNGNLLLDVGPRADGSIPELQVDPLQKLGDWLAVNGEGICDTRPWVRPSARNAGGAEVRFTRKGGAVYAFFLERPSGDLTVPGVIAAPDTRARILGAPADSEWKQEGHDLIVQMRGEAPGKYALGVKISPVPWQLARD